MARFFFSLCEIIEIQFFSGKLQNSLSQSSLYKNVMLVCLTGWYVEEMSFPLCVGIS